MAHLTLQVGGPIVVPFSIHFGSRKRRGVPSWKVRSLLKASAIDAGFPTIVLDPAAVIASRPQQQDFASAEPTQLPPSHAR